MMLLMPNGTFRLKGREILKLGNGADNAHQLSLKSQVSWPTVYRVVEKPEEVRSLSFDILASILIEGLGFTPDQVKNIRLGELFDYIPEDERAPK